jgi:CYTH domain-containing protein
MKIKTVQKLILAIKKEIDSLLVTKSNLEEKVAQAEKELANLKEFFKEELDLAMNERIFGFNAGEFIKHHLTIHSEKEFEITSLNNEIKSILEEIISKNIDKKTYEHIHEQIVAEANIKEAKFEIEILDRYSLIAFAKED